MSSYTAEVIVFIGDGAGHGIAAAFTTIMAKMSLDELIHETSLTRQLEHLNSILEKILPEDRYMSGILVKIAKGGQMITVNAGHPSLVMLTAAGELKLQTEGGLPLGLFENNMLELCEEKCQLEVGDRCFLITDGIIERANRSGELYGMKRFTQTIQSCKDKNLSQLMATLTDSLENFAEGLPPDDDVTIVAFEFKRH